MTATVRPALFRSQALLDTAVESISTGNYPLYRGITELPFVIASDGETRVIDAEEGLRRHFATLCDLAETCHPAVMTRQARAERAAGASLIVTRYTTTFHVGSELMIDPFDTLVTYRLRADGMRAVLVANPVGHRMLAAELPAAVRRFTAQDRSPRR